MLLHANRRASPARSPAVAPTRADTSRRRRNRGVALVSLAVAVAAVGLGGFVAAAALQDDSVILAGIVTLAASGLLACVGRRVPPVIRDVLEVPDWRPRSVPRDRSDGAKLQAVEQQRDAA